MHGFKILCEISKVPFEISYKILNAYAAKYAFYEVLKIWRHMLYFKNYDLLSLSDTGPWGLCNIRYPSKTHLKLKPREISFIHDIRFSCLIVLTFCTEHGTDIALLCANFTRARLGRVTPLGRPKQVYKSNVECRFLGFWVETAKLPWRSSSMTPSLNTSWENPKMHI